MVSLICVNFTKNHSSHRTIFQSGALKRFLPLFDRVLVQRAEAVSKTKGGIIIPEKSQGKVLEATVVAAGPGARNDKGESVPMSIAVGDKVMLPEFGGTKIELDNKEYTLFREADIVAKFAKEWATNDENYDVLPGKLLKSQAWRESL